jgi:D-3-phosphoglycerate dehydrogenase / 2-oxoglutarate reductase
MKVLANDGISDAGAQKLTQAGISLLEHRVAQEQLIPFINQHQITALLVRSATKVNKELIDACPSLKIIGRCGVGTENIDTEYALRKGLYVINDPSAAAIAVAELVFAHFMGMARFLHDANREMPLEGESSFNELKKSYSAGIELKGKTLGVIGMGRIGQEVLKIGIALGMKVLAYNRTPKTASLTLDFFDGQKLHFNINASRFEDVIQNADFISINTAKTEGYLIDEKEFKMMKDGVIIANTARGGAINEANLLQAIELEKVRAAALDVFETEPTPPVHLLMNPALSLSPHLGANTLEAQERIGIEIAKQIIAINLLLN